MTRAIVLCLFAFVAFGRARASDISVSTDELRKAIAGTALLTTARPDRAPVLNGTEFRVSANQLRMVSTDGWRIAMFLLSVSNAPATPAEAAIDNDFMRRLHPKLRGNSLVNISFASDEVAFQAGADKYTTHPLSQAYPDWAKAVVGKQPFAVTFKRQEFVQALQGIPGEVVGIRIADGAIAFRTKSGTTLSSLRTVAPVRQELVTSVNPKFLLDFVTLAEGDTLELAYSKSNDALRLQTEHDNHFVYYLLPKLFK